MEEFICRIEKIVYRNEMDGFTVLHCSPEPDSEAGNEPFSLTAVGKMPEVSAGDRVRLQGEWKVHARYGRQFGAECCEKLEPEPDQFALLFERLSRSSFRSRFSLSEEDRDYVRKKGRDVIRSHACDFIRQRLAPAEPKNDGKQTPMRGHPVFKAQHATATCCRNCLRKWHGIPQGRELTAGEQEYVVDVIMEWIRRQMEGDGHREREGRRTG